MECSFIKCWLPHAQYGEKNGALRSKVSDDIKIKHVFYHKIYGFAYYVHNFGIFVPIKVRFMTLDSSIHCNRGAVTPPAWPNEAKGMIAHTFLPLMLPSTFIYLWEGVLWPEYNILSCSVLPDNSMLVGGTYAHNFITIYCKVNASIMISTQNGFLDTMTLIRLEYVPEWYFVCGEIFQIS